MRKKKSLGQHFLSDRGAAQRIANSLNWGNKPLQLLEIGPGNGALTEHLLKHDNLDYCGIELDRRLVPILTERYGNQNIRFVEADVLQIDLATIFNGEFSIVGNFPYNISSQIVFRVLEYRNNVAELVGMFQKEVAERICAGPGTKKYGIISVLTQVWYDAELLLLLPPEAFRPPPAVHSGVIRLQRNGRTEMPCDEKRFKTVVKLAFNTRRKMLRNSLKSLIQDEQILERPIFTKRPEQLDIQEFFEITQIVEDAG